MGIARYQFHNVPSFGQFYKKVLLRLSEHGDVIETQTIRFVPPKVFWQTRSLARCNEFKWKRYLSIVHNLRQLLIRTRFFVFTKFSMHNGSHMDAHRIYDLTVVHRFKCFLTKGLALFMWYRPHATLGLPDVNCKNTGRFVNSDRSKLCTKCVCNGTGFLNSIF